MVKEFAKVSANTAVIRILKESLETHLRLSKYDKNDQKVKVGIEIEKVKSRITNARRLMLDKKIEVNEYRKIKEEYEAEIEKLELKIEKLSKLDSGFKEQIAFCCELLQNLLKYFLEAGLTAKQHILGLVLSEKLVF